MTVRQSSPEGYCVLVFICIYGHIVLSMCSPEALFIYNTVTIYNCYIIITLHNSLVINPVGCVAIIILL